MSRPLNLTGICKSKRDVGIFFAGIRRGILEMEDFPNRKNVNTGEPLTIEEMRSDWTNLEDSAKLLFED